MAEQTYFDSLNYTLGNEDTALEYDLLPPTVSHLYAVAGSGSRVLPLMAKKPKKVTCVDTSRNQLYLTELRIVSLKTLTYAEFLGFWGYPTNKSTVFDR